MIATGQGGVEAASGITVVKVGTLIDGTGAAARRGMQVVVKDGRIVDVGPSGDPPSDAAVLDYASYAATPGLIDCHVHLVFSAGHDPLADLLVEDDRALLLHAASNARIALAAGVTTVRDLGDRNRIAGTLRDAIADGRAMGPRIMSAGAPITISGGHCHWLGMEADTEDDVRRAARRQLRDGADCLKVMATGGRMTPGSNPQLPQYTARQIGAAVEEARRVGKTIAAHALSADGILAAAEAGVDTVEHCNWLDRDTDGLAFKESTAVLMAEKNVAFDPTLTPVQGIVDRDRATLTTTQLKAIAIREQLIGVFRRMLELGVTIVAGTDAGTRTSMLDSLPREIALYVDQLGLSPLAAIHAGTGGAASQLGIAADVGTIRPGRWADLAIVEGDPSADIRALGRSRAVIKGGVVVAERGLLLV